MKMLFLGTCFFLAAAFFSAEGGDSKSIIIMFGAPGVGKGVQASKLREELHVPHISTGDLFRENLRNETAIGLEAKTYIDAGQLVPDEVVIKMLFERISQDDCREGYILDGFPRTLAQARELQKLFGDKDNVIVLDLQVSDDVVVKRITDRMVCQGCGAIYNKSTHLPKQENTCDKCGGRVGQRPDDTEVVVRERLRVYEQQTAPVKEYYVEQGVLRSVDGSQPPDEVFDQLAKIVMVG